MPKVADTVRRYFAALGERDLEAALQCWRPGGLERMPGGQVLIAPDGIREYFAGLFGAFPDFTFEVLDITSGRGRAAVRWRAHGTFAGPGTFQGFAPNHARIRIEGCDVITVDDDDRIVDNDVFLDSGDIARQLGLLPAVGSPAEARLARVANVRTRLAQVVHGIRIDAIADGVWLVRGGFPAKTMNVYLIRDGDGVTVFDAGIEAMGPALRAQCARLGGARRVVLGHADADHRGAAAALDAPVYCHPGDRAAAESAAPLRDYWQLAKLRAWARPFYARVLPAWDGGALSVAGTLQEGDEVAGFEVVHLPGHAPGLIALYRPSDRLALVSDAIYTLDPQTGIKGPPRVPHPAFNQDEDQARASIRKLAARAPLAVWPGHADPVLGDVRGQLEVVAG